VWEEGSMELELEEEEQEPFNTNNNTSLTLGGFVIALPPCEFLTLFLSSLKINHCMHNYIQ
jgi:hypothetical protein